MSRATSPKPAATPAYACQLRLGRPGVRLVLAPPVLEWTLGPRQGTLPLADIAALRLTWRPGQLMKASHHLEITARDGLRLEVGSVSRVSIAGVRDQGPEYAAFVRALHGALAAAGARPRCLAGFAPWRWWSMVALAAVSVTAALAVVLRAGEETRWSALLFFGFLFALVAVPALTAIVRNRPDTYAPDRIPERLLPG